MLRITSSTASREILAANQRTLARMTEYQLQLSDGKRLHSPGDDPVAVRQAIRMRGSSDAIGGNLDTIDRSLGLLYAADNAFAGMTETLQGIKGLAVEGATDSTNAEGRVAIASQIDRMLTHLVDLANSSHDGRYLFAGTDTTTSPFVLNAQRDQVTYHGNQDVVQVDISPVSRAETTQDGSAVMQQPVDVFDVLIRLRDALNADDGATVRALISDVDDAHTQIANAYGDLGGREARMEATRNQLTVAKQTIDEQVSQLEDADLAEVISQFTQSEMALQAGLQAGARVLQTTLLDYI